MVKVTLPLGSEAAHGAVGKAIVFQGTMARQYVTPQDTKTAAQLDIRNVFRVSTKLLSRCGDFPRAVFRKEFGGRWFTFLSGRVSGNWNGAYQTAVTEFDTFPEGLRNEWDAFSPYLPGTVGMGRAFYGLIATCYSSCLYGSGKLWGISQWGMAEAALALSWWTDEVAQVFLPGLYDDADERIRYSAEWSTQADVNAINGNYHFGGVDDLTNCQFFIDGAILKVLYPLSIGMDAMRVIIDGDDVVFSHTESYGAYFNFWVSVPLTNGLHEVDIRQTGLGVIAIDGVEVE